MSWRRLNHVLHRDIGYLCIGMTLIYVISGVAVNHITHQFNPSYSIDKAEASVRPVAGKTAPDMVMVTDILKQLHENGQLKNVAMLSPGNLRIFVEGNTIDVELATGKVQQERVQQRPLLFQVNYLHLNKAKGGWTYLADAYAILLGILAMTGMLMIRGRNRTRGLILTCIGFLIPIAYLFVAL